MGQMYELNRSSVCLQMLAGRWHGTFRMRREAQRHQGLEATGGTSCRRPLCGACLPWRRPACARQLCCTSRCSGCTFLCPPLSSSPSPPNRALPQSHTACPASANGPVCLLISLHKAGQESTRDNIRFRKHLPSFINTALESSWLIRRCLSRGVRVSAEIAAGNVAVKAAAHGIQAPSFSPGITARVQLPRSFPAAAPSTSGDDMADLFAGVPSSADDAARWERANAARKLAMLQQDIEARLQHNERLAQGFDSACVSPAVSSTPEQQTPASMEQQSEIDKERALTAFLERAVMSC